MHITSSIIVKEGISEVWDFMSDPLNTPKWDSSITMVMLTTPAPVREGSVVEAIDNSGMRQTFRITKFVKEEAMCMELVQSGLFKKAKVCFDFEAAGDGTRITHRIDFLLKWQYLLFHPILLVSNKRALTTDMEHLRLVLNSQHMNL